MYINRIAVRIVSTFLFFLVLAALPIAAEETPLSLEDAVRLALERNEVALIAGESEAAARARVAKALSYFFPSITGSGTYTRRPFEVTRAIGDQQIVIQSFNALAGSIGLNLILLDSTTIPGYAQARLEGKAQKLSASESRRQLAFEVAAAFLMTLSVDQVTEASRHRFDYASKNLEAARARYSAGLVSINDVTRCELELATADRDLIQAQGRVETTYLNLEFLIDAKVPRRLKTPGFLLEAADVTPPDVDSMISEMLTHRLDIQALQFHARAVRASMVTPTLRWLPSISLTGQYRYTNEAGLTGRTTNWNVGLSLNWSIFDGFGRDADFRERRALARMAELDVKSAQRRSEVEIRDASVSLANQQAALKQAQVAAEVAQKNTRETEELYRQGLATALQAADALVRLYESEVALVSARSNLALALLDLRAAQGLDPFGKEPIIP